MKYRFKPQDMMVPVDGFKPGDVVWSVHAGAVGIVELSDSSIYPIKVLGASSYTINGAYLVGQKGASIFFLDRPGDRDETIRRGLGVINTNGQVNIYWEDRTANFDEFYSLAAPPETIFDVTQRFPGKYKTECKCAVPENWDDET